MSRYRPSLGRAIQAALKKFERADLHLSAEKIQDILSRASEVGIDCDTAWSIIADYETEDDFKPGIRALIAEIRSRSLK